MSKLQDLRYLIFLEEIDPARLPRDLVRHIGYDSSQPDLHFFPVIFDRGYYLIVYWQNRYILTEVLGNIGDHDFGRQPVLEWIGQDVMRRHKYQCSRYSVSNVVGMRRDLIRGFVGEDSIVYRFSDLEYVVVKWELAGNHLTLETTHDYQAGRLSDSDVQLVSKSLIVLTELPASRERLRVVHSRG